VRKKGRNDLRFGGFSMIKVRMIPLPGTELKAYKMEVAAYKTLARIQSPEGDVYDQKILNQSYRILSNWSVDTDINFYLSNKFVLLFPQSGKGFHEDIRILQYILKQEQREK
jgi:hypothetical protein